MQGYILKITPAKNEDLIVNILTKKHLYTLYRFYGARHSIINLGYKIDFEIEYSQKAYLPRLRNITHLGFKWLKETWRVLIWQQFIQRMHEHLRDLNEVESIYFDLLEESAQKWHIQNPKRICIESYVKLLEYEGRLHKDFKCFVCHQKIENNLTLTRAFLPAHYSCIPSSTFPIKAIKYLYENKKSLLLEDKYIDKLYNILMLGF